MIWFGNTHTFCLLSKSGWSAEDPVCTKAAFSELLLLPATSLKIKSNTNQAHCQNDKNKTTYKTEFFSLFSSSIGFTSSFLTSSTTVSIFWATVSVLLFPLSVSTLSLSSHFWTVSVFICCLFSSSLKVALKFENDADEKSAQPDSKFWSDPLSPCPHGSGHVTGVDASPVLALGEDQAV